MKFNLRTNDVRHFPKGIFPNGNFPNVKFLKSVLTAAAALGPLAYFRRFRKPNITFGKFGNREIVTWEVGLGEMPLGKYLARVAILLNRCESDSLLNKWRVTWKLPLVRLGWKIELWVIFCKALDASLDINLDILWLYFFLTFSIHFLSYAIILSFLTT